MERFFTVDGAILSINQDCSITEFATLAQAFEQNPLCVLKGQATFENMVLANGRKDQWYQSNKYILFADKHTKTQLVSVGNWSVKGLYEPRNADALHCSFVDPLGKIAEQIFKGSQSRMRLTQAFAKLREMNNYESALNYNLLEENLNLKQEITKLKEILEKHNANLARV